MIRMISSANFKNSDAKTNFPSNSGEPETDDFAALLDGMSFVIPPVIQQPVNTPTNFSPENSGENSSELLGSEIFGDGGAAQTLPQFDDSAILPGDFSQVMPKEFTSNAPENLFAKVADVAVNPTVNQTEPLVENVSVLPKSFDVKPEIPTVRTGVEPDIETETAQITQETQPSVQTEETAAQQTAVAAQSLSNQFAAQKNLSPAANRNSAKTGVQTVENTSER